ncbi:MAG: DNA polymerase III, partial [Spirochaetota bacterium]
MFENIIGQDAIVERLSGDIRGRQLPSAMLFAGPEYSGKLSTALELTRILTCTGSAEWSCRCRSCGLNRELIHPRSQLLGSRYFVQEILTSGETLKYATTRGTAYLYLRSVRKLLRRLDPVLWEGEEQKLSKALESLAATEEALEPISRIAAGAQDNDPHLAAQIDAAREAAFKTLAAMPADLVPVATVRRLASWLHGSADGPRTVIIENVDQLGDASINALLKMLEEPPQECWFILTTSRRGAVLPTIRSRVREYRFRERPVPVSSEVIQRVFRGPADYRGSIRDYFLEQEFPGTGSLRSHAERFLESVIRSAGTSEVDQQHGGGDGSVRAAAEARQSAEARPNERTRHDTPGGSAAAGADPLREVVQALSEV